MTVEPADLDSFFVDGVTPVAAGPFNEWGAGIKAAWEQTIAARAGAEAAAAVATAPTDGMVAGLVGTSATATRDALDLVYGGTVNVRAFGATGDGTTDDTAACQAALNAAVGGQVFLPAGVYSVNPLYVPIGTRVFGAGLSTVIRRRAATVTNTDSLGALNVHGTSGSHSTNVSIESLTVDGNKANVTVGGGGDPYDVEAISLKWADRFRISAVRVINANAEGIDVDDSTDGLITGVWGIDCGGSAVHLSNGSARVRVTNSYAVGCGATLLRGGFDAHSGGVDHLFSGCVTISCYRGITLNSAGSLAVGCQDFTPTAEGFRAAGAGTTFSACRTTGNIAHVGTSGALIGCSTSGVGATVTATNPAVTVTGCTPDTPPEATLTYTAGWTPGGTVRVVRRGDVVTATYRFDKNADATEQETMVTLPVGFRPLESIYAGGMVFNNGSSAYLAGGVQIQTTGGIQVRLCGVTNVRRVVGQATWRVAP